MSLASLLVRYLTFAAALCVADENNTLDFTDLAPSCYEPDPYNIDECFESCAEDTFGTDHWGVSLEEIDFDIDMDATIFTYAVNVWESGVCRDSIQSSDTKHSDHEEDHGHTHSHDHHVDEQMNKDSVDPSGIEGLYIMFDGCCNDSSPAYFTKAITPQMQFTFLEGGWYWETMVYPGFANHFGFMIHGQSDVTTGTVCVRTGYHCVCQPIAVPDLCHSQWEQGKVGWAKSGGEPPMDDDPIWKHD